MILMASVVFSSSELRNKVCQICNACLDRDARKCFWEATKEDAWGHIEYALSYWTDDGLFVKQIKDIFHILYRS